MEHVQFSYLWFSCPVIRGKLHFENTVANEHFNEFIYSFSVKKKT